MFDRQPSTDSPAAPQPFSAQWRSWFGFSLLFAGFYSVLVLQKAWRSPYAIQDDAREYLFWMQRFIDPELLPNDLIADYFQSITPSGYAALYWVMSRLGIPPLEFSKILPIALSFLTTIYGFRLTLQFIPIPATGFVVTVLLNQSLWFRDDLASATPRAFVTVLFLAFIDSLLRQNWWLVYSAIALQALFYPPTVFLSIGVLLWRFLTQFKTLRSHRMNHARILLGAIVVAALAILPYALSSSRFSPTVTLAQGLTMPEFWEEGRHPYFDRNLLKFWLTNDHSGLLPSLMPPLIWSGVFLPILLRQRSKLPVLQRINPEIRVLGQILIVSLIFYCLAHLVWLKLFFPQRYLSHTLRIVLAIASGILLTAVISAGFKQKRFMQRSLSIVLSVFLIAFPHFIAAFPFTNYRTTSEISLYQFLQQQPKNTIVATLSDVANFIPIFGRRSVLFAKELSLPFHLGYYRQIQQRIADTLTTQYSPDLAVVDQVIQKYRINFWILERNAFTPTAFEGKEWLKSFQPAFDQAIAQRETPAIAQLTQRCSAHETPNLIVLDTNCIQQKTER